MNRIDSDTNPSQFLNKLGCRDPKLQISVRNIPLMGDDDDPKVANLYYQIAANSHYDKEGYHVQSLRKRSSTAHNRSYINQKSEIIQINKSVDNRKWIEFEPVDSIMIARDDCAFGCDENENWAKMKLMLWNVDDDHFWSTDDVVASFYFGYGDEVFDIEMRETGSKRNICELNKNDYQKFNRGFYEEGRYEVAWCVNNWSSDRLSHDDSHLMESLGETMQVKLDFYCF